MSVLNIILDAVTRLVNIKNDIRSAIIEKGGSASGSISTYANAIRALCPPPVKDLKVLRGSTEITGLNHMGTVTTSVVLGTYVFSIYSGATEVYVNGRKVTTSLTTPYTTSLSLTLAGKQYLSIVTKTGNYPPFVTFIEMTGIL